MAGQKGMNKDKKGQKRTESDKIGQKRTKPDKIGQAGTKFFADYRTHVRYGETDKMKVAYYGNYLVWFEAARSNFGRTRGLLYADFEKLGYYLVVAEAYCRYLKPLQYNDEIIVRTTIPESSKKTVTFAYDLFRAEDMELCAKGYTRHVCVDRKTGRPATLPPAWLHLADD